MRPGICSSSRRGASRISVREPNAGVVISGDKRDFSLWRDDSQIVQEFMNIAHLGCELPPGRLPLILPVMPIVLQHRAATGHVHDDRVPIFAAERGHVRVGKFPRRVRRAGVIMDRPAASLTGRQNNVATICLEHAGSRPMGVAKNRVGYATGEQRHPRTAAADGGQHPWQRGLGAGERVAAYAPIAAVDRATTASGPAIQPPDPGAAIGPTEPARAIGAFAAGRGKARTESSAETNRRRPPPGLVIAPSRCETVRSSGRTARRRDKQFHKPGNPDKAPDAGGLQA